MTSRRRPLKFFENFGGLVIGDGGLTTFPGRTFQSLKTKT